MRRFRLIREEDLSGISGTGLVAEGVEFTDKSCVVRWRTEHRSTTFYASIKDVEAIHGHNGATRIAFVDITSDAYGHGHTCCYQDRCENVPFGCVGGEGSRENLQPPDWLTSKHPPEYVADWMLGYMDCARELWGPDWRTAKFGWSHVATIGGPDE